MLPSFEITHDLNISSKLTETLIKVVEETVTGKEIAIAFSGGLDCGIITAIASESAVSIKLYTVGTENSYDVNEAKKMAKSLDIDCEHLLITEGNLIKNIHEMIEITKTTNPIVLSFEVPLFYVSKYSKENYVMTGQGADELFAGYSKYVGLPEYKLRDLMKTDMEKLVSTTLPHEQAVSRYFGKTVLYPYLDSRVLDISKKMDVKDLIFGEVRKNCLRRVAVNIGWSEIAVKRKKAAQYGSGTMDILRKIAKQKGVTISEIIRGISIGEY
ncbi:MAG: asparagine synthase C-terminal domain-containing protein [archaeon]|nr:asparagine synthase C-terminal domain-containing protein [archaeon]